MPLTVLLILLLTPPTQSFPSKTVETVESENVDWRFNQNQDLDEDPTNPTEEQNTSKPSLPPNPLTTGSAGSLGTSNETFLEQCWQTMERISGEILSWNEEKPEINQLLIKQATHQALTSNFIWGLFLAIAGYILSLTSQCLIAYCCRPKLTPPTVICRHRETPASASSPSNLVQERHTSQLQRLEQATNSIQQNIAKQSLAMQHFMREQFATIKPRAHEHLLDSSSVATSTATLTTIDTQAPEFNSHSLRRSKSVKMVPTPQLPREKIDLADFEDSSDCESQYELNRENMAISLGAFPKLKTAFLPSRRPAPTPPQPATTFTRQTGGGGFLRSSIRGSKRVKTNKYDDDSKFM